MARSQTARKSNTPTVGELIDALYEKKQEITAAGKIVSTLKEERDEIIDLLVDHMEAQGISKATGKLAGATLGETIVPQIDDFDKFWRFMKKNDAPYLLEKRPAAAPFRELLENRKGRPIPGLSSFPKKTINTRKL